MTLDEAVAIVYSGADAGLSQEQLCGVTKVLQDGVALLRAELNNQAKDAEGWMAEADSLANDLIIANQKVKFLQEQIDGMRQEGNHYRERCYKLANEVVEWRRKYQESEQRYAALVNRWAENSYRHRWGEVVDEANLPKLVEFNY